MSAREGVKEKPSLQGPSPTTKTAREHPSAAAEARLSGRIDGRHIRGEKAV